MLVSLANSDMFACAISLFYIIIAIIAIVLVIINAYLHHNIIYKNIKEKTPTGKVKKAVISGIIISFFTGSLITMILDIILLISWKNIVATSELGNTYGNKPFNALQQENHSSYGITSSSFQKDPPQY